MPTLKKGFLIIVFALAVSILNAQNTAPQIDASKPQYRDSVWIVNGYRGLGPLFRKWKFDFVLDARQTLVSNTSAKLFGVRIGMEYRRVHRFGIGFYNLSQDVKTKSLLDLDPLITEANLNMGYISLFYERVLFFNRKWEWSATVHQGRGQINGSYKVLGDSTLQEFPIRTVKPFEISTTGYYNITWWCSLGAGVGYRYIRSTPAEVRAIYSAPVGIVRVRIKLGKLTRSLWNADTKNTY